MNHFEQQLKWQNTVEILTTEKFWRFFGGFFKKRVQRKSSEPLVFLERKKGFEPSTPTLARLGMHTSIQIA